MSTISLRLSQSLHRRVRDLAKQDEISINQFIATALAEKMSALMTSDYLGERAKRGRRGKFERQWQRFEMWNLIRKMLCKMPPNHRLKLTAHLANFPNARDVACTSG